MPNAACTDCAGVINGTAAIDACGTCSGGNTGIAPNAVCTDCAGIINGTASIDACGICSGGNTGIAPNSTCLDCAGVVNGTNRPGTPCDDNDPNTFNDVWGSDCQCAGVLGSCNTDAGPDQIFCGTTGTMAAVGTNGVWSGPDGIIFSDPTSPTTTVSSTIAGSHTLLWTENVQGCIATDIAIVTFIETPDAAFNYGSASYCQNNGIILPERNAMGGTFTSGSGLALNASTGAIDPALSQPGTFIVVHSFDGTCPASSSFSITILTTPDAGWAAPEAVCANNAPIQLSTLITGDAGGTWSGSGVSGSVFNPAGLQGTIAITRTISLAGCTDAVTRTIRVHAVPVASAGPDAAVCGYEHELTAVLHAGNGYWSGPQEITFNTPGAANALATASAAGTYTLQWTVTENGCRASDEMELIIHDPADALTVDAGPDLRLEVETSTSIHAQASPGAAVQWSVISGPGSIADPQERQTTVSGLALGTNTLVITVSLGQCTGTSDTLIITVEDLFIPQGFSPNGDGDNDLFVVTGMMAYPGSDFTVFNRWGQKVYANSDYANEWDGRSMNGQYLPNDTYFYVLNLNGGRTYNGYLVIKR